MTFSAVDNQPPFALGEKVSLVQSHHMSPEYVACPVCYKKRLVTLILGNDERVLVKCENCSVGSDPPSGFVTRRMPVAKIISCEVRGFSKVGDDWKIDLAGHHSWIRLSENLIFRTEEEAEPRRAELLKIEQERADRLFESIVTDNRKRVTWTVGYHRNQIRELKRKLEWHEKMFEVAKEEKRKEKEAKKKS